MKRINVSRLKAHISKQSIKDKARCVKGITRSGIERFHALDKRKKIIVVGGVGVGVVVVASMMFASGGSPAVQSSSGLSQYGVIAKHKANPVLERLAGIEGQIQDLQTQQQGGGVSQTQLDNLNNNLVSLKQAVANLQQSSPQNLTAIKSVVRSNNQSISGQLSQIKQTVEQLKQRETPKHYLPVSALPWAIDGVDVRNYQPVVIRADGYGAITKGDVRDGWKLITVKFNPPLAVFQNVRHASEYVRVSQ